MNEDLVEAVYDLIIIYEEDNYTKNKINKCYRVTQTERDNIKLKGWCGQANRHPTRYNDKAYRCVVDFSYNALPLKICQRVIKGRHSKNHTKSERKQHYCCCFFGRSGFFYKKAKSCEHKHQSRKVRYEVQDFF